MPFNRSRLRPLADRLTLTLGTMGQGTGDPLQSKPSFGGGQFPTGKAAENREWVGCGGHAWFLMWFARAASGERSAAGLTWESSGGVRRSRAVLGGLVGYPDNRGSLPYANKKTP